MTECGEWLGGAGIGPSGRWDTSNSTAEIPRQRRYPGELDASLTAEGPAYASPSVLLLWLERRDVCSHFHRDGYDFRFRLGPGHLLLQWVVSKPTSILGYLTQPGRRETRQRSG